MPILLARALTKKTPGVFAITLLVALVSTTATTAARADGPVPVKQGGATAGALAQDSKPKAKPAAKPTAKAPAKPQAKPAAKPAPPQKVPRAIGPKEDAPAKPATETPKEGEETKDTTGTREEKAGKVDGRKWRPRRRG